MQKSAQKSNKIPKDFNQTKNQLAQKVLSTDQPELVSILNEIYLLYSKTEKKRTTVSQYNKEIEAPEKRIKSGKSIKLEDVLNEMENW
jgi:hypothetical protein